MRHRPANVVLLDIALPDNDGLNLLEKLLSLYPELIIIVVSSFDDRSYVDRALDLGARGYLIKDCAVDELHDCLRDVVLDGHIFISNSIGARQPRLPEREDGQSLAIDALTPGERKVMAQLAHCLTSKEIAKELGISHRTVQNHRQKISSKLGVSGMHQLMKIAQRHFPTGSSK
jgi:DNA-binding NarL/FixJ family response regulator